MLYVSFFQFPCIVERHSIFRPIAAAGAFAAPGIAAEADCSRYTAQVGDIPAVVADSLAGMARPEKAAHMAGMAAHWASAAAAGNRESAAAAVAMNCPCSSWNSSSSANRCFPVLAPGSQKGSARS